MRCFELEGRSFTSRARLKSLIERCCESKNSDSVAAAAYSSSHGRGSGSYGNDGNDTSFDSRMHDKKYMHYVTCITSAQTHTKMNGKIVQIDFALFSIHCVSSKSQFAFHIYICMCLPI